MTQSTPPPDSELAPGTLLSPRIRLQHAIGQGGMGVVWLAQHAQLGLVAVKIMKAADPTPEGRARFEREARMVSRIQCATVVRFYELGVTSRGRPFIVMELLRGRDLKQHIEASGPLRSLDAALVVRQVCEALAHAHELGVVHRDLKPANVFLVDCQPGSVKVLDFGVAKLDGDTALALTRSNAIVGTPQFMSPEQLTNPRLVDARSDLWSAAALAYACLVGRPPFTGETIGALTIAAHSRRFVRPSEIVPGTPAAVDTWFERALEPDRDRRFQSARELATTFAQAIEPTLGAVAVTAAKTPPRKKRGAAIGLGIALGLGAIVAGGALAYVRWWRSPTEPRPKSVASASASIAAPISPTTTCVGLAAPPASAPSPAVQQALLDCEGLCDKGSAKACAQSADVRSKLGALRDPARAAALYSRACDGGESPACTALARAHYHGRGVPEDWARAFAIADKHCQTGVMSSCALLGLLYASGHGVKPDVSRGIGLLKQACDAGDLMGCINLAIHLEQGEGIAQDHATAAALMKRACDGNEPKGCAYEHLMQLGDRSPEALARANRVLATACDGGDARACGYLGRMYETGAGVPKDPARSFGLFRAACDGDDTEGCVNLGMAYWNGSGVAPDFPRAVELFRKTCSTGSGWGCENLGQAYFHGLGVSKDMAMAASHFRTACDAELAVACHNLAALHLSGEGVQQDDAAAVRLWERACRRGNMLSCEPYGHSYLLGRGVPKDDARAATIFFDACNKGHLTSCAWCGHLHKKGVGVPRDAAKASAFYAKACGGGDTYACEETRRDR